MKTALITGGLGFIGTHIAIDLLKNKKVKRCILLDNFGGYMNPTKKSFYDFRKKRLDLIKNKIIERCDTNNFKSVLEIIKKHQPEIIYHTAALPLAKLDNLNTDEAKIGSIDSTVNLLDSIVLVQKINKKYKCKRFVYISSSMVYGDFKTNKVNELSTVKPKEAYGTMKLAGEIITEGIGKLNNIPYTIIRPSAVYGPTDMNRRVSQIFIESAFTDKEIQIEGKDEKLDFTFIDDLAKGCVLAGTKDKGINQIFNITYGKAQSLYSYVMNLKKFFPNLKFKVKPRDKTKPSRGTLSINKAKKLLKFNPKYSLKIGIKKYIQFLIDNKIYK
jgi:UDP-glucose 4-epimerase